MVTGWPGKEKCFDKATRKGEFLNEKDMDWRVTYSDCSCRGTLLYMVCSAPDPVGKFKYWKLNRSCGVGAVIFLWIIYAAGTWYFGKVAQT